MTNAMKRSKLMQDLLAAALTCGLVEITDTLVGRVTMFPLGHLENLGGALNQAGPKVSAMGGKTFSSKLPFSFPPSKSYMIATISFPSLRIAQAAPICFVLFQIS